MSKYLAALAAVSLVANMVVAPAFADQLTGQVNAVEATDSEASESLCSYCWEKGEFTTNHPVASQVGLFPLRVTTAAVGAPIGALGGFATGMGDAMSKASDVTFNKIPTSKYDPVSNGVLTVLKAPFLLTAGIVGTTVAMPLGATYGTVKGTFSGAAKGYTFPDKL